MSRLTDKNRVKERGSIFYDEYTVMASDAIEELVQSYGDTIVLLRKQITPRREIDTTGAASKQGRLSGRRMELQTGVSPVETEFKRPEVEQPDTYSPVNSIPAIVIVNSGLKGDTALAATLAYNPTVYISMQWLKKNSVEINEAQDIVSYKNKKYFIDEKYEDFTFLNSSAQVVLRLRKADI